MKRSFYLSAAFAALLHMGGVNFASAQETTTAPPSPPQGQTDQSEDDWRNENKTTDKKIEDILNPDPNSGGNGWGITLPPLDDMDQLPAESQKHLKRERNKVIGQMDMKTGDIGNTDYKPSPAAEDDPSLQAEEKAAWTKMMGDLKGAVQNRGKGSGEQETGSAGDAGGSSAGASKEASKETGSRGPAPQSILGRGGRRSASDMMRGGNPGPASPAPSGPSNKDANSQPKPTQVAVKNPPAGSTSTGTPERQDKSGGAQGSTLENGAPQSILSGDSQGRDSQSMSPEQQAESSAEAQNSKSGEQKAGEDLQGQDLTKAPSGNPSQSGANKEPETSTQPSGNPGPESEQASEKPTSETVSSAPQMPPAPPKPSFMSFLRKLLGGSKSAPEPADNPETSPASNKETLPETQIPSEPMPEPEPVFVPAPSVTTNEAPTPTPIPVSAPDAPLPTSTEDTLEELIGESENDGSEDYAALEDLIKLSEPPSP